MPPESPPPFGLLLVLSHTSEWLSVSVPPSLEIPPPEPEVVWPPSMKSSLRVRFAWFRMLPPKNPLVESAVPKAMVTPEIATVGLGFTFGLPTMSNTRKAVVEVFAWVSWSTWVVRAPAPEIVTLSWITSGPFVRA